MLTIRSLLFLAVSAAALACGSSADPDTTPPTTKAPKVDISIASVSLADDCGTGPTVAPPVTAPAPAPAQEKTALAESASQAAGAAGKMAPGSSMYAMADRACEQSSIQLRVANSNAATAKVAIQKIELIDESGAKVAELTPREPSRWVDDSYQSWDEQVATDETLAVSYALSAPNVMRGATYTVRVVIAADGGERTLEQKTTLHAEASLPPGVVT